MSRSAGKRLQLLEGRLTATVPKSERRRIRDAKTMKEAARLYSERIRDSYSSPDLRKEVRVICENQDQEEAARRYRKRLELICLDQDSARTL